MRHHCREDHIDIVSGPYAVLGDVVRFVPRFTNIADSTTRGQIGCCAPCNDYGKSQAQLAWTVSPD